MPDQDEEATLARLREEFDPIKVTHLDRPPKSGANLIAEERDRQREVEGWTKAHDDAHDRSELALAAVCYALPPHARRFDSGDDRSLRVAVDLHGLLWPFSKGWWKPTARPAVSNPETDFIGDRVRELVKAGALIAAEIDRLQRAESSPANVPPAVGRFATEAEIRQAERELASDPHKCVCCGGDGDPAECGSLMHTANTSSPASRQDA